MYICNLYKCTISLVNIFFLLIQQTGFDGKTKLNNTFLDGFRTLWHRDKYYTTQSVFKHLDHGMILYQNILHLIDRNDELSALLILALNISFIIVLR